MKLKTFEDLYQALGALTKEERQSDITIYDAQQDETFGLEVKLRKTDANDERTGGVLDDGHPYLELNGDEDK